MSASNDGAQPRSFAGMYRIVSGAVALLVLIQAILAGRGWFIDFDLITLHGVLGNITFIGAVGMVVLAWVGFPPGRERTTLLVMSAVLTVLTTAQIGLGYTATSEGGHAEAASLHIPLGVLIFGFSCAINARLFGVRR